MVAVAERWDDLPVLVGEVVFVLVAEGVARVDCLPGEVGAAEVGAGLWL